MRKKREDAGQNILPVTTKMKRKKDKERFGVEQQTHIRLMDN
jgi:hypothetical protein